MDYKLLSEVLAKRLRKVMEQVVYVDQTYCVPSRLIADNITLIWYELGLILMDQEKAFNWTEHQYLRKRLQAFGSHNIESVLKVNGGLCVPFRVQGGESDRAALCQGFFTLWP